MSWLNNLKYFMQIVWHIVRSGKCYLHRSPTNKHSCKIWHLCRYMWKWEERDNLYRRKLFWHCICWIYFIPLPHYFWLDIILWFVFMFIVGWPKPSHIVMWEHNTTGLFSSCTTGEYNITAHAWSLIFNLLIYHTIFDLLTKLHDLAPVVYI